MELPPLITTGAVITDCRKNSDMARLATRFRSHFGFSPTVVKIKVRTNELERGSAQAVMHLLDQIDASRAPGETRTVRERMLVLINSAPRGEASPGRPNGSPFCYWWADRYTLIVSTIDGPLLPHANYLGLIPSGMVHLLNVADVLTYAAETREWISRPEAHRISKTQFRSLDFQPLVAKWLLRGWEIPSDIYRVPDYQPDDVVVLYSDSFGNLTLNVTPEQFGYEPGQEVTLLGGKTALCVPNLTDVPQSQTDEPLLALTIGSNGLRDLQTGQETRFLQLVIARRSAAKYTGLRPGKTAFAAGHIPANQIYV